MKAAKKKTATRKPRTAYELLDRVAKHILEEPKRYYQGEWANRDEEDIERTVGGVPECGTMACRAGWIVALHDGLQSRHLALQSNQGNLCRAVPNRAIAILGMKPIQTGELFDGFAIENEIGADETAPSPGTKEYARLGVKGIRAFMKRHAAHLKARLLKGV